MSVSNSARTASVLKSRPLLEMSCGEARAFFLKQQSYCTIELPPYFKFEKILDSVSKALKGKSLAELGQRPRDFENVNHLILNNKDGRHAWRPLQLIHPALYVSLVNQITEKSHWELICKRFADFSSNDKIKCLSLPVKSLTTEGDRAEQITRWWHTVEQESIKLAMDYDFVIHTDIVDCYGAIYTHSIAWAIHTKPEAKKKENRNNNALVGSIIDNHIQDMRHGQTNGIPQGAVLMDFIAEMVLGYADMELTLKIPSQTKDYCILRYRDDYRIFVNSSQDGERILKCLTEVMMDLGLKLNPGKTKISNQVIGSSLKDDKLSWMCRRQADKSLQKHLLIIHNHSIEYPNAGSLVVALGIFHKRIVRLKKCDHAMALISIVVDIAYHNPRTYPTCALLLSKLISLIKTKEERQSVIVKTKKKFSQIPNTGLIELWLQRISLPFAPTMVFDEPLCRLIHGASEQIWSSEWISSKHLRTAVDAKKILDKKILKKLDAIISAKEVSLFIVKAEDYS